MTNLELVDLFFEKIEKEDFDGFYKFFTKDTVLYVIDEDKTYPIETLEKGLRKNLPKFEKLRRFESSAAIKQECKCGEKQVDFIFDIRQRRIYRLELTTSVLF